MKAKIQFTSCSCNCWVRIHDFEQKVVAMGLMARSVRVNIKAKKSQQEGCGSSQENVEKKHCLTEMLSHSITSSRPGLMLQRA